MKQISLFDKLPNIPRELFQRSRHQKDRSERNVLPGKILFHQGGKPERVYEVVSGTLKLSRVTENGHHIILGFPSAGAIVGLTGAKEYQYAAETLTPSTLLHTRLILFQKDIMQNMANGQKLLQWIDRQEMIALDHISILALHHPASRIAVFLMNIAGKQRIDSDSVEIQLPMTQRDIAAHLAIAPETYSRCMKKLRANGIVRSNGRGRNGNIVEISDMAWLARIADGAKI